MEEENAREVESEIRREDPAEKTVRNSESADETTELIPSRPEIPIEVEEALTTLYGAQVPWPAADSEGVQDERRVGDGGSTSDPHPTEEIRKLSLGLPATNGPDLTQVIASLEERLDSARRKIVDELAAVERRIRDDLKGSIAKLRSEAEDRARRNRESADEPAKTVEQVLNLVTWTHRNLRTELDEHRLDTKRSLDELLLLVRALATGEGVDDEAGERRIGPRETAHQARRASQETADRPRTGKAAYAETPLLSEAPSVQIR